MLLRKITPAVVLGALALGATMTPAPGSNATPGSNAIPATQTEATSYKIDSFHSTSHFRVHHGGAGMFYGRFNDITGTINYDADAPESLSFDVTIDVESVDTNSDKLDNHLKSPDFFNAKEFSSMTFKSKSASQVDDDTFEVTGELSIHGVTKAITTQIDLTGVVSNQRGKKVGFEAIFSIDRTEFGMTYGAERGALGKDVRLIVSLEAIGK